jgi:hypothetical protein
MKAQISFVEFLTALAIFLASVTYISFQISTFIPNYLNEVKAERMRSEAFQLSELLINDPGNPANWYTLNLNNVVRLGLSDEKENKTNLLSYNKILKFNETCNSNYPEVKKKLGLDYDFSLVLKEGTSEKINCSIPITRKYTTIRRIVAYRDNNQVKYGEMILQVW